MKPSPNHQYGKVGNAGDRLKHRGLIAGLLASCMEGGNRIGFIDTHAFAWTAPCPDPDAWRRAVSETNDKKYWDCQPGMHQGNTYRCSPALATHLLTMREEPFVWLGESAVAERHALRVASQDQPFPVEVVADGRALLQRDMPAGTRAVTVHVDPFMDPFMDPFLWEPDLSAALDRWHQADCIVHLQIYAHGPRDPCPQRLGNWGHLLATGQDGLHRLAAYVTYGKQGSWRPLLHQMRYRCAHWTVVNDEESLP